MTPPVGQDDNSVPVEWSKTGTETFLANPGGGSGAVRAINAKGEMVGYSGDDAVEWSAAGAATVLKHPGVGAAESTSVNVSGASVGFYVNAKGDDVACRWSSTGVETNLQTILGAGWSNTGATQINNAGDICGNGQYDGVWQAFLLMNEPKAETDAMHRVDESPIEHAHHIPGGFGGSRVIGNDAGGRRR